MTARVPRGSTADMDSKSVRRASLTVGINIAIASAVLVVAALAVALVYIAVQLTPAEQNEAPKPGRQYISVDTTKAVIALVIAGLLAVVVASVLSLIVTRRAVAPLGRALRLQRDFVQDASHELRTPLTVLDARLQIMQRSLAPDDPLADQVKDLRGDAKALIDIVSDLLLAAETDSPAANRTPVPMAPSIERATDSMRVLAHERGISIECQVDGSPSSFAPATSVQRCATVFLDNAIAHSPDGGIIRIGARRERRSVFLTCSDEGGGIRGIDPDRIFDRFAHAAPTPTGDGPQRPAFGIGLALVRDIASAHGGSVEVLESSEHGTTLSLKLPAAR